MTLCVTYITDSRKAVALTDSLITTTRNIPESGSFLPSDQEVLHQTPYAVKVHKISSATAYAGKEVDILTTIAGNVLLGLQCALHIDSYLKYGFGRWFGDIEDALREKVLDFWVDYRDKQLQMSFALFDHKMRPHLLECRADQSDKFCFQHVEPLDGFSLSVLGDDSEEARQKILSKTTSLLYQYVKGDVGSKTT